MVNKQVNICDGCGKRTADRKCILCGNDLCTYCNRASFDLLIRSKDITVIIGEICFCKGCKGKLRNKLDIESLFAGQIGEELIKKIGGELVKKMLVDSL